MNRPGRFVSPRRRLLAAFVFLTTAALALTAAVTFAVLNDRTMNAIDVRLSDQVENLRAFQQPELVKTLDAAAAAEKSDAVEFSSMDRFMFAVVSQRPPGTNETSVAIVNGRAAYQPGITGAFDLGQNKAFITEVVDRVHEHADAVYGTFDTKGGTARYIAIPVALAGVDGSGIYVHAINVNSELGPIGVAIATFVIAALVATVLVWVFAWFAIARFQRRARAILKASEPTPIAVSVPPPPAQDPGSALEMMELLEGSAKAQRQLLDDVRHELKTPITIVRGYLEMMDASDKADVLQAREIGISELDRMTRLVEDIDALATVEGDEYTMGTIDIAKLTMRVAELVSIIPSHQWQVTQVASGIIRGNPDRLLQGWLALSDNAIKYTPAGSVIEIGSRQTPESMMLWIRDHGPGIPPAARHRIFQRFDRGAGKREVGGSGLGLAIVDAIARAHGGSCTVTETPGGGATFTIHLPVRSLGGTSALPAPVRAGDVVDQWKQQ